MHNIYNSIHTLDTALAVPDPLLQELSKETPSEDSRSTTPVQGVICNHFSFSLLYHTVTLSPFTCKLFSNNTFVDSLPLPTDPRSYPLSLTQPRYYLNEDLNLITYKTNIPYPPPPIEGHTYHSLDTWSTKIDDPMTIIPSTHYTNFEFLTICTHLSCRYLDNDNSNPIGFLIQSPPPGPITNCPPESTKFWLGPSEKCITLQHTLPDSSLAPYFVPFSPSKTKKHLFFLEPTDFHFNESSPSHLPTSSPSHLPTSSPFPPSSFLFTIKTEIAVKTENRMRNVSASFLLKGLPQPSLIVNNCHVHDLHSIFPQLLSNLLVFKVESLKVLRQKGMRVTFHTALNSYGLVVGVDGTGQLSLTLAPLQTLVSDVIELRWHYPSEDWPKMKKALEDLGMEVTQVHPPPLTQEEASTAEHATDRDNPEREINMTQGVDTQGVNSQGVDTQGVNSQGVDTQGVNSQGVDTLGVNSQGVDTQGGAQKGKGKDQLKKTKHMQLGEKREGGGGEKTPSQPRDVQAPSVSDLVGFWDAEPSESSGIFDGDSNAVKLTKGNGEEGDFSSQEGKPNGEGSLDGMTPYIIGAVIVVAVILFFFLRRRGRRGRKEERVNSPSQMILYHNFV